MPPFFCDILVDVLRHKKVLGGLRCFSDYPRIDHKVKAEEFRTGFTDFEYVFLTVLGFARLHTHGPEIVQKSNGKAHRHNPGVQLLEITCGMTMHGDREGAKALLQTAPTSLLEAYRLSKGQRGGTSRFFKDAFDRTADPCLEGRLGRLLEYLEKVTQRGDKKKDVAPWEDVSLQPISPTAPPNDVVGEHLRVFINECTWQWARDSDIDYEAAKQMRHSEGSADDFNRRFNADTFRAAMRARNIVKSEEASVIWEVQAEKNWLPFEPIVNMQINNARQRGQAQVQLKIGPKGWTYEIDLRKFVQRNPKTQKERPIRCGRAPTSAAGVAAAVRGAATGMRQLSAEELETAIVFFVEMATLPEAPEPSSAAAASSAFLHAGM